jgi:curved DNA-binding protein CbpA
MTRGAFQLGMFPFLLVSDYFCIPMKDYYAILGCTPMSTREEIRRNYRKLAHEFHPDKNPGDNYAESRFHDIKEAFETLTQPARKEAWLQERWLRQVYHESLGESEPLTPYSILNKVLKLDKYVSSQDIFRMDQYSISKQILNMVSEENINCLLHFKETDINRTIIQYLLSASRPIALHRLDALWPTLEQIAENDQSVLLDIRNFRTNKKSKEQKERWTLPMVLVVTFIICLIIFYAGK